MELSKKETFRNKKVSLGVTLLSFVVMLVFFIFTNVITANSSNFVASPQIVLSMEAGNEYSEVLSGDPLPVASSHKESSAAKIQTAATETRIDQGVSDIIAKYNSTHVSASSETIISDMRALGDSKKATAGTQGETKTISPNMVFSLGKRTILSRPAIHGSTQAEGTVVVDISVDKTGKVIDANPNGRGSNTNNPALKSEAAKLALATKFNADSNFEEQRGTITIIFSFDQK